MRRFLLHRRNTVPKIFRFWKVWNRFANARLCTSATPIRRGFTILQWEILDNAVDEYINGYADHVTLILHKSRHAITISDNGRGMPVDVHPRHKKTGLELILTVLHAGGKFGGEGSGYVRSGGLHGVGASVVNAAFKSLLRL